MQFQPALHRLALAQPAMLSQWILPRDHARAIFRQSKACRQRECICRVQQNILESRLGQFYVCLKSAERAPAAREPARPRLPPLQIRDIAEMGCK